MSDVIHVIIDPDGDPIPVDATMSEDHNYTAEVSSYPIEDGSDVVDNVRIKPFELKLECVITDTPMLDPDGQPVLAGTVDGQAASAAAYVALGKLFAAKKPVAVITSLDHFENMVITDLSIPRSADVGHAINFTVSMQQVIIIENKRTTVSVPMRPAVPKDNVPYILVFSVLSTRRAEFASYGLIVTDKTSPTGPDTKSWDHFDVGGNTTVVSGSVEGNTLTTGLQSALADGYVDVTTHVYHPYRLEGAIQLFSDVTGITYDQKSGQWLGDDGKPVSADPGKSTGPVEVDKAAFWQNWTSGGD